MEEQHRKPFRRQGSYPLPRLMICVVYRLFTRRPLFEDIKNCCFLVIQSFDNIFKKATANEEINSVSGFPAR